MFLDHPIDYQVFFQDPATRVMESLIDLHNDIMFFLIFIIIFVTYVLARTVMLCKRSIGSVPKMLTGENPSRRTKHHTLETIWTIIPAIILVIIAIPSFILLYMMDNTGNPVFTVKCIGRQWYWNYELRKPCGTVFDFDSNMITEEDLTEGHMRLLEVYQPLVLPVNTELRLLVTSFDVIHSFTVPSFGIKIDACPGRLNEVALKINRTGTFYGQCSELCGINHSQMPIMVKVVNFQDFVAWLTAKD